MSAGESTASNQGKIVIHADPEIQDMIPRFLNNRKNDVKILLEALSKADFDAVESLGHKMKGAGAGYGFQEITRLGGSLETAAQKKESEEIRKLTDCLGDYLERIEVVYG